MDYTRGTRFYLSSVCLCVCVCRLLSLRLRLLLRLSSRPSDGFVVAICCLVWLHDFKWGLKLIVLEIGRFACACQFL